MENDSTRTVSGQRRPVQQAARDINIFRKQVLDWYDSHRRRHLPWRADPGQTADPYHVWLSEVMLQQTVVNAVIPYFFKFIQKWPTVHDLAAAPVEEVMKAWAGLGYYARARNMHKCAQAVVSRYGGEFPESEEGLKSLPGIGPYTAAAITSIAFDRPAIVVDGNIERVMARYFAVEAPLPGSKVILREKAAGLCEGRSDRPGDFAQALMDIGATICIPKTPRCGLCPLQNTCQGRAQGIAAGLPRRAPRRAKPQKFGYVYWITDPQGRVLIEQRPPEALLGGMPGLPTSEWVAADAPKKPQSFITIGGMDITGRRMIPTQKEKQTMIIHHSFTHFDLSLETLFFDASPDQKLNKVAVYNWITPSELRDIGFPRLFDKVVKSIVVDQVAESRYSAERK